MKVRIQVIVESDESPTGLTTEVASFQRDEFQPGSLGLTLAEAKDLLAGIQETMVHSQVAEFGRRQQDCPVCGQSRPHKGHHAMTFRSLFGRLKIESPRFYACPCQPTPSASFSPLAQALPEHTTPELLYLESKWAALMPYGVTIGLLKDVLPVGSQLNATSVRRNLLQLAERAEQELKNQPDQPDFPLQPADPFPPAEPVTLGIDGGYVHACQQPNRGEGWFEVIVGKSLGTGWPTKCFGYVQCYDEKPERRVTRLLKSQGFQRGHPLTFLSDGGETVRNLPWQWYPAGEHLLDWFHITMRLTVMNQMVKGLSIPQATDFHPDLKHKLEQLKWYLWHGNTYRAFQVSGDLVQDIECLEGVESAKLLKKAMEFDTYIQRNQKLIPNYGDRYRYGERISTGFAESTVNQVISKRFVKKQQMRWTKRGAHLLLQIRTKVLNHELRETVAKWYPGMKSIPDSDALTF